MRTKKAFPEDEVVWKVRQTTQDWADVLQNRFELEKRIGKRWQVSTELVHELEAHHGQLTEVEPGFKYVAYFDALRTFIASVGMTAAVPLNQPDVEWAAVPYVALAKGRGPNFTLQGSVKANLPTDEFQRDGNVELASVLHFLPPGMPPRGVFPGLEVIVGVPFERAGQDVVQVALAPQMRIALSKRGHVAVHVGGQVPLNERDLYDFRGYGYFHLGFCRWHAVARMVKLTWIKD